MFVRALLFALILALTGAPAAAVAGPKAKVAAGAKKAKKKKRQPKARTTVARPAAPLSCANTELAPAAGNLDLIRDALACLHNQTRAGSGAGPLAFNDPLAAAAAGHANDMVARGYFAHVTPEGGYFDERILATGYARGANGWDVGENLIWASGDLATPAALMRSWLASPGHRANVVKPEYRELGLGVTFGTPSGGAGVTVAAEFGSRVQ